MSIFGYDWEDIQRAQQGGRLGKPVKSVEWTETDQACWDEHKSIEALEAAGLYGVADRAKRKFA